MGCPTDAGKGGMLEHTRSGKVMSLVTCFSRESARGRPGLAPTTAWLALSS